MVLTQKERAGAVKKEEYLQLSYMMIQSKSTHYYLILKHIRISDASFLYSKSSRSCASFRQVTGFTPFPLNHS